MCAIKVTWSKSRTGPQRLKYTSLLVFCVFFLSPGSVNMKLMRGNQKRDSKLLEEAGKVWHVCLSKQSTLSIFCVITVTPILWNLWQSHIKCEKCSASPDTVRTVITLSIFCLLSMFYLSWLRCKQVVCARCVNIFRNVIPMSVYF